MSYGKDDRVAEVACAPQSLKGAPGREDEPGLVLAFGAPARAPRKTEEEDDDMDLPPLDTDPGAGDDDVDDGSFDDALPDLRDDGGDPLDDANAQDLDVGLDVSDDADAASGDDAEEGVDVGSLDEDLATLDGEESALDEDRDENTFGDDDASDVELDATQDDGGAEGTGENAENDVDESALPELDESANDEADDEALADELLEEAARGKVPPWAPSRFVVLEGAGAPVPCTAVTVCGGRVLAAGDVVLVVDEGAHAARQTGLDTPSTAVVATDEVTVVASARGGLLVSRDGCASATPVAGFRSGKSSVELAATPGRIWILHEGSLWSMTEREGTPVLAREGGVRAIKAAGGTLVVLATRPEGAAIERLRGDDEAWQKAPLEGPAAELAVGDPRSGLAVAAAGRRVAIVSPRGLLLSNDGAHSFESIDLHDVIGACFAGDEEDAPLYALMAPPGDATSYVVRVGEDGDVSRVAELRGQDGTGLGEASIAWDGSREVVWIASRLGLVALGPARPH
ncbi:hypothetical protein [Polyangium sp. 15x6]|uniref:hypothetical protein n=1 Tax=Polyangium sp. 15x6 TaxID=3042687 RepID=UPI00249C32C8|nr:hypothetical protein [Polyangium sp. 15x6]MDI3289652.1 hypothetical protein [Polyangium sp. 15x6]